MRTAYARALPCAFAPELDGEAFDIDIDETEMGPSPEPGPAQDVVGQPRSVGFVASAVALEAAMVVARSGHSVFLLENAGFRPCYFIQDGFPVDFDECARN